MKMKYLLNECNSYNYTDATMTTVFLFPDLKAMCGIPVRLVAAGEHTLSFGSREMDTVYRESDTSFDDAAGTVTVTVRNSFWYSVLLDWYYDEIQACSFKSTP